MTYQGPIPLKDFDINHGTSWSAIFIGVLVGVVAGTQIPIMGLMFYGFFFPESGHNPAFMTLSLVLSSFMLNLFNPYVYIYGFCIGSIPLISGLLLFDWWTKRSPENEHFILISCGVIMAVLISLTGFAIRPDVEWRTLAGAVIGSYAALLVLRMGM